MIGRRRAAWWLGGDPDATVALRSQRLSRSRYALVGVPILVVLFGIVLLRPGPAPDLELADEAQLLAAPRDVLRVLRFRPAPSILVLIFPSMHAQAASLNRMAAFAERGSAPHDRVLDDAGLTKLIAARHAEFDTLYYAHDYRAAELARFFAVAARDAIHLRPEEQMLRARLAEAGALAPDSGLAAISLPPDVAGTLDAGTLDTRGRRALLVHELSHGAYFTDDAFAAAIRGWWDHTLTIRQREVFRQMLARADYEASDEDLMRNEAQAYLVFTPDARLFNAQDLGVNDAELRTLRDGFPLAAAPAWLRNDVSP